MAPPDSLPTTSADSIERATKVCPDCAESIKSAANVCRFCGHRFNDPPRDDAPVRATKSVAGAAVLSLVIAGLGQLYLGERARGAIYLAAVAIGVVGGIATATPGPAVLISVIAAVDAAQSAKQHAIDGSLRGATGRMWALLAAVVILVSVGISRYDAGAGSGAVVDGQTQLEWKQAQYQRCVADGQLAETSCANIYLAP